MRGKGALGAWESAHFSAKCPRAPLSDHPRHGRYRHSGGDGRTRGSTAVGPWVGTSHLRIAYRLAAWRSRPRASPPPSA
eukprot:scaffold1247_cov251-Pinguiococcus_pyrenoidosus.AAC.26